MNKPMVFNNPDFGAIRAVEIDGEPWLVGKDVALALGYKDSINAVKSHVDYEDKKGGANHHPLRSPGNDHHQRERPVQPDLLQPSAGREEVQAVGYVRGPALHPQDRLLQYAPRSGTDCQNQDAGCIPRRPGKSDLGYPACDTGYGTEPAGGWRDDQNRTEHLGRTYHR